MINLNKRLLLTLLIVILLIFPSINIVLATNITSKSTNPNSSDTEYRAVLFALDKYHNCRKMPLKCPVSSLKSIEKALEKGSYDVHNFTDNKATVDNFNSQIDLLSGKENNVWKASENDVTIFYFCGHGDRKIANNPVREGSDDCEEYLCFYKKDYRDDLFIDRIVEIPGNVVIFLDNCYCQGFENDLKMIYNDVINDSNRSNNVVLFTARDKTSLLSEKHDLDRAIFSFNIVSGLQNDENNDSDITLGELFDTASFDYSTILKAYGESDSINVNVYPKKNSIDFPSNLKIIKGFSNKRPDEPNVEVNVIDRTGKISLDIEITDSDNDLLEIIVFWGDGKASGWLGPYTTASSVTKSHRYSYSFKFDILVIVRDSSESFSTNFIEDVEVESKPMFYLYANHFKKYNFLYFLKQIF